MLLLSAKLSLFIKHSLLTATIRTLLIKLKTGPDIMKYVISNHNAIFPPAANKLGKMSSTIHCNRVLSRNPNTVATTMLIIRAEMAHKRTCSLARRYSARKTNTPSNKPKSMPSKMRNLGRFFGVRSFSFSRLAVCSASFKLSCERLPSNSMSSYEAMRCFICSLVFLITDDVGFRLVEPLFRFASFGFSIFASRPSRLSAAVGDPGGVW